MSNIKYLGPKTIKPPYVESLERTKRIIEEMTNFPTNVIKTSGVSAAVEMLGKGITSIDRSPAIDAISAAMINYDNMIKNITPAAFDILTEFNSKITSIYTNQQIRMLQETVTKMGRISSIYTESIQNSMKPLFENLYKFDGIPIDDLSKEEVHDKLVESADEQYKETGTTTPYNVLSMEHIFTVVLPGLGVLDALEDIGTMSPEVAFNFFLFSIVPMIYTLVSIMKSKEPVKIVFDEEFDKEDEE